MKSITRTYMEFRKNMPFLQNLLGLAIEEVFWDGDVLGLSFGTGWCLTIYNRFSYQVGEVQLQPTALQRLKGATVMNTEEDLENVSMRLTGEQQVIVDLSTDGFNGPEAMQLTGPSGEIVVWP